MWALGSMCMVSKIWNNQAGSKSDFADFYVLATIDKIFHATKCFFMLNKPILVRSLNHLNLHSSTDKKISSAIYRGILFV